MIQCKPIHVYKYLPEPTLALGFPFIQGLEVGESERGSADPGLQRWQPWMWLELWHKPCWPASRKDRAWHKPTEIDVCCQTPYHTRTTTIHSPDSYSYSMELVIYMSSTTQQCNLWIPLELCRLRFHSIECSDWGRYWIVSLFCVARNFTYDLVCVKLYRCCCLISECLVAAPCMHLSACITQVLWWKPKWSYLHYLYTPLNNFCPHHSRIQNCGHLRPVVARLQRG